MKTYEDYTHITLSNITIIFFTFKYEFRVYDNSGFDETC